MLKSLPLAFAFTIACASTALAYDLSDHERKIVRDGFSGDPQFGELKAAEDEGNILVCGKVNVKNQFGQYMGETLFAGALLGKGDDAASFHLFNDDANPISEKANSILCAEHGLNFN